MEWRKSTYSSNGGAACVEVGTDSVILVRDTTNRAGDTLGFAAGAWHEFAAALR